VVLVALTNGEIAMRNKRLILALAGAVVCGLLGVLAVTRYLSGVEAFTKDLGNVVVAKQEIPLGTKITKEQITLAPIPNGSVPEGAFRKIDDVVGRVAIQAIGVRETITPMKLAPEGTGGGLSAVIPEGYRAITVKVDDVVGISGFVMPGSYVDVVAVITPTSREGVQSEGPISKIVLQRIKVLASGPKIDSPENQREPTNVKAVTLMVTPEEAEKLVLAANEGKLQLVMRNYSDDEDADTKGSNKNTLLRGDNVNPEPEPPAATQTEKPTWVRHTPVARPKPEKPATAPVEQSKNSVELIEGSKRRDVTIQ
jgi:pilus assembly protein CpaB